MGKKNKEKPINEHPNKIGIKEAMGYMLGDSGNLFVLTYISYALKLFYTEVLHINPDQLKRLFLITRLWDAINDPLWGSIVAKRPPRKDGKFRPYIKFIAIPVAVSQLLCFYDISQNTKNPVLILVFAYVTYISFGMMYTGINVPFGSLASVITDDPNGRTLLSTFRSIGGGIGGAAPLLLAPYIIYNSDKITVNSKGMFYFAVAMCIMAIIFYMACYAGTKERVKSEVHPNVNMKKTYMGMLKSRPFIVLAVTGVLISGQLQFASYNAYLYKNYFENSDLNVYGTIAQYLPMAIMIPFTPMLVKKFGKKELAGFGSMFAAAAAVICFIVKPERNQPWIFILTLFIIGFGYSFVSITNWAVVADVIDYQFVKTGIRSESAVYAVYTFSRKLGQTIADYVGMALLSSIGYDSAEMSKIGYKPGVSEGILTICTLIPAITYTAIWLLYRFAYPLTKEKMEPIYKIVREENDAMYTKDSEAEATAE
ncbi:MAG: glycoside-pentoside-hexuronide (GPH):cation symporter [Clostridiales bacterium]|nr:glycoside-pentoside-hexuronide (GPH):cation symporter [Clostridiales bacterium]